MSPTCPWKPLSRGTNGAGAASRGRWVPAEAAGPKRKSQQASQTPQCRCTVHGKRGLAGEARTRHQNRNEGAGGASRGSRLPGVRPPPPGTSPHEAAPHPGLHCVSATSRSGPLVAAPAASPFEAAAPQTGPGCVGPAGRPGAGPGLRCAHGAVPSPCSCIPPSPTQGWPSLRSSPAPRLRSPIPSQEPESSRTF